jgi:hypothetical protein
MARMTAAGSGHELRVPSQHQLRDFRSTPESYANKAMGTQHGGGQLVRAVQCSGATGRARSICDAFANHWGETGGTPQSME